ncbi:MAG: exosortase-associated EpsI family protein [Planctomycetota bacterium]
MTHLKSPPLGRLDRLTPALTAIVLLGLVCIRWVQAPAADADTTRSAMTDALEAVPYAAEEWIGVDSAAPAYAMRILKPDGSVHRWFRDASTDRRVLLQAVYCSRSRDLIGHAPPVCYGGQGWTHLRRDELAYDQDRSLSMPEPAGQIAVDHFSRQSVDGIEHIAVYSTSILPMQGLVNEPKAFQRSAIVWSRSDNGGLMIQMLVPYRVDNAAEERGRLDRLFRDLIQPVVTAAAAIGSREEKGLTDAK